MEPLHQPKIFDLSHAIPQSEDTGIKPSFMDFSKKRKNKHLKNQQHDIITTNNAFEEESVSTDT